MIILEIKSMLINKPDLNSRQYFVDEDKYKAEILLGQLNKYLEKSEPDYRACLRFINIDKITKE